MRRGKGEDLVKSGKGIKVRGNSGKNIECRKREVIVGRRQDEEECMKTADDVSEENLLKKAKIIKNGARGEGDGRSWSRGERKWRAGGTSERELRSLGRDARAAGYLRDRCQVNRGCVGRLTPIPGHLGEESGPMPERSGTGFLPVVWGWPRPCKSGRKTGARQPQSPRRPRPPKPPPFFSFATAVREGSRPVFRQAAGSRLLSPPLPPPPLPQCCQPLQSPRESRESARPTEAVARLLTPRPASQNQRGAGRSPPAGRLLKQPLAGPPNSQREEGKSAPGNHRNAGADRHTFFLFAGPRRWPCSCAKGPWAPPLPGRPAGTSQSSRGELGGVTLHWPRG